MEIILNSQSNQPIYEQIYLQIKTQISNGELQGEDELPSIRRLASDLQVSAITTKKAYEELVREGYVLSRPGRGMYVNSLDTNFLQAKSREELRKQLYQLIETAKAEKISLNDFLKIVTEIYRGENDEGSNQD